MGSHHFLPPSSRCVAHPVVVLALAAATTLASGDASAAVVPGRILLAQGDVIETPDGPAEVDYLARPATDGERILVLGSISTQPVPSSSGPSFAFVDDELVYWSEDVGLSDGISIYTALGAQAELAHVLLLDVGIPGYQGIWHSVHGLVTARDFQAPSEHAGAHFASFQDLHLDQDGGLWFIAILDTGHTGIYRASDGSSASIEEVWVTGIDEGGGVVGTLLRGFDVAKDGTWALGYRRSDSTSAVLVDGTAVLSTGDLLANGDPFERPARISMRNDGEYMLYGDRLPSTFPDGELYFQGLSGAVDLESNVAIDGVELVPGIATASAINDAGGAALVGRASDIDNDPLFVGCDASDLAGSLSLLAREGDEIDTDGDDVGDLTVGSFLDHVVLTDTGTLAVHVYDANDELAIIAFDDPLQCPQYAGTCGDGVLDEGEACDDGVAGSAACTLDCEVSTCGDGFVNFTAGEACDDGSESAECDDDCSVPVCGDGNANQVSGEICDTGGPSVNCDDDCTPVECGDGVTNLVVGEQCDDAGESATCNADCTVPVCGDGMVNAAAGEACDDGNTLAGDGCSPYCTDEDQVSESDGSSSTSGDTTGPAGDTTGFGFDTDTDTDTDGGMQAGGSEGCGCRSTSPRHGKAALALLVLGLVRRRRGVRR